MTDPRYLTVEEASELSGMTEGFIRAGIVNGTVPGSYISEGGGVRKTFYIPRKAFMDYLEHWKAPFNEEILITLIKSYVQQKQKG